MFFLCENDILIQTKAMIISILSDISLFLNCFFTFTNDRGNDIIVDVSFKGKIF